MTTLRASELARIGPISGSGQTATIPDDCRSVAIYNGLTAPIYGRWSSRAGGAPPTATAWDIVAVGSGVTVVAVPENVTSLQLVVIYPGAVPAADVQAVVVGSPACWTPSTGALA